MNIMQTHHYYNAPKKFRGAFGTPKKHLNFNNCFIENYCGDALHLKQSIEYWKTRYDEEVLFLDSALSSFYEELKRAGLLKNTMFIITSDHGELFGEMGHFMHKFSTYNSITHIPLMIKFAENVCTHGNFDDRITQLNDLFSTILDILELPFPKPVSSFSLLSSEKRRYAIAQDFYSILKANQFLKKYPKWNFKALDFFHSNMAFLIELDNVLYKVIYYSNGKFEFYKLSDNLYENNTKEYHPDKKELRKLQNTLYEPHLTIDQFVQSLPEDEKTTLSVKKVS